LFIGHVFPYPEKLLHLVTSYHHFSLLVLNMHIYIVYSSYHHFSLLVLNIHIYVVYWNIYCLLELNILRARPTRRRRSGRVVEATGAPISLSDKAEHAGSSQGSQPAACHARGGLPGGGEHMRVLEGLGIRV